MSPDLATALRTETPTAPERLRDRVVQLAAAPPPTRRSFPVRRLLAIGVPARTGRLGGRRRRHRARILEQPDEGERGRSSSSRPRPTSVPSQVEARALAPEQPLLPSPSGRRAQDYTASLTVLVDGTGDLSETTQRALRATRRFGGYVVNVQYGTPEPAEGTAALRVRIPVSRVQAAIVEFSDLGRILAQQVADLRPPAAAGRADPPHPAPRAPRRRRAGCRARADPAADRRPAPPARRDHPAGGLRHRQPRPHHTRAGAAGGTAEPVRPRDRRRNRRAQSRARDRGLRAHRRQPVPPSARRRLRGEPRLPALCRPASARARLSGATS